MGSYFWNFNEACEPYLSIPFDNLLFALFVLVAVADDSMLLFTSSSSLSRITFTIFFSCLATGLNYKEAWLSLDTSDPLYPGWFLNSKI